MLLVKEDDAYGSSHDSDDGDDDESEEEEFDERSEVEDGGEGAAREDGDEDMRRQESLEDPDTCHSLLLDLAPIADHDAPCLKADEGSSHNNDGSLDASLDLTNDPYTLLEPKAEPHDCFCPSMDVARPLRRAAHIVIDSDEEFSPGH